MLIENVIIVDGQDLSDPCENEQADASQYSVKTESH